MATSEVEICNNALLRVGITIPISSLDEAGSEEARVCKQLYAQKRDELLQDFDWSFARRRVALAQLATTRSDYLYVYGVPDDCISPRCILPGGRRWTPIDKWPPFEVEAAEDGNGQVILCNVTPAELRYTMRFTAVGRFPPLWTEALAWLLAAELAQALKKDTALSDSNLKKFVLALSRAKKASATERQDEPEAEPSYISGRR